MTTIIETRAADLDSVRLDVGQHDSFETGHCALEVVAWLVGDEHTDRPACVPYVLADTTWRLNDALLDSERSRLIEYLPHLVDADERRDARRYAMLSSFDVDQASRRWSDASGDDPLGLTSCSAKIASSVRAGGAAAAIEASLAPSAIEVVAQRLVDAGEATNIGAAQRRIERRIEREDEFVDYRAMRLAAVDDLLALLTRLVEA